MSRAEFDALTTEQKVALQVEAFGPEQDADERQARPKRPDGLPGPGDKLIPVPVRLTPAQRDKLQRIGPQRLRDWLDRVKE